MLPLSSWFLAVSEYHQNKRSCRLSVDQLCQRNSILKWQFNSCISNEKSVIDSFDSSRLTSNVPCKNTRQNFENAQRLPRRHLLNMIFGTASLRMTMFSETPVRRTDGTAAAAIPHYQRNTLQTYLEIMVQIFVITILEVVLI